MEYGKQTNNTVKYIMWFSNAETIKASVVETSCLCEKTAGSLTLEKKTIFNWQKGVASQFVLFYLYM